MSGGPSVVLGPAKGATVALRAAGATSAGVLAAAVLVACGGSGGSSTPTTPTAEPVRSLPVCASTVTVPADLVRTAPSAVTPPTSVLRVGEAVQLPVPSGSDVGQVGAAGSSPGTVVCRAAGGTGTATLVAQGRGYVRVAVVAAGVTVTDRATKRLFVKVSG